MQKNSSMRSRVLQCAMGIALTALVAGCGQAADGETQSNAPAVATPEPAGDTVAVTGTARLGTITTRVGGQSTTWETHDGVPGDDLRRASASVVFQGPMAMINLQALLPGSTSKQASLSANLMDQGKGYQPMDGVELDMLPEGGGGPHLQGMKLQVQWDRVELGAEGGHVQGTFTGFLCPLGSASERAEGCTPLEGEFDSQVRHDQVVQDVMG